MSLLARVEALEHAVDAAVRLVRERLGPPRAPTVICYDGWIAGGRAHVRARVLASPVGFTARASAWVTLRETLGAFASSELPGVVVKIASPQAVVECASDDDGYIAASVPVPASREPFVSLQFSVDGGREASARAYRVPDDLRWLVISDIDDTLLTTGTWNIPGALWLTLAADVGERRAVRGMPALVNRLSDRAGEGPVFYVSSSPWNLHRPLAAFIRRSGLPPGPMVLTDLGLTKSQVFGSAPGAHKIASIEMLLEQFPQPAVLVGDTSQEDAVAYASVAVRHPGRVRAVLLRAVPARPGNRQRAERLAEKVGRTGTLFSVGNPTVLREAAARSGLCSWGS